jgi:hypothetical protein
MERITETLRIVNLLGGSRPAWNLVPGCLRLFHDDTGAAGALSTYHEKSRNETPGIGQLAGGAVPTEQAVEKGTDARRRAPRHPEAYFLYVEGCRKLANEADGPLSAAC